MARFNRIKFKKPILSSILISSSVHLVFFICAAGVRLPGISTVIERSRRIFNIKTVQIPEQRVIRKKVSYIDRVKFESPLSSKGIFLDPQEDKQFQKDEYWREEEMARHRPLDMEEEFREASIKAKERPYYEAGRRPTRKELVELEGAGGEETLIRPEEVDEISVPPPDFLQKMPGFTPKATGGIMNSIRKKVLFPGDTVIKAKGGFADLEEYLVCKLFTYQDPDDGQKYFKIGITAGKDADRLESMPKELVFLVDCSLSIQKERLEAFKKGLEYCLRHLNTGDLFNIMSFKDRIGWFRPSSVEPNKRNIRDGLRFVKTLTAGEGTDAYKALYESIQMEESMTPSYIMLLSDGRPTHGVTDPTEIINKISRVNNAKRPIFAFSGGSRVNRYLLDFISYKNRGWSEYAPARVAIKRYMAALYEKIKDPILLNLRYRFSGLDSREVFPKSLPDFYRNAEFTIFGRYEDEDEFSLQLLGDTPDETNEFIIVGSLNKAQKGTRDIAKEWAFNKIYHLIGLLKHGSENRKIIEEVNSLCDKFDIKTPYSDAIKRR